MNDTQKRSLRFQLSKAFSPSAPITLENLFAGRTKQLQTLMDAIPIRGRHAIVYGERGVGKTSLARVLRPILGIDEVVEVPYVSCDSTDCFDSVWRKVFSEVSDVREGENGPEYIGTAADGLPSEHAV